MLSHVDILVEYSIIGLFDGIIVYTLKCCRSIPSHFRSTCGILDILLSPTTNVSWVRPPNTDADPIQISIDDEALGLRTILYKFPQNYSIWSRCLIKGSKMDAPEVQTEELKEDIEFGSAVANPMNISNCVHKDDHSNEPLPSNHERNEDGGEMVFMDRVIRYFDSTYGKTQMRSLTYAQRTMFSTIKASSGLVIVAYYLIFMGVVFGAFLELFLVEASRTNKSNTLLRSEASGWLAFGAIVGGFGLLLFFYIWRRISDYFASDPEGKMHYHFGCPHREGTRSTRLVSTDDSFILEHANSHAMLKEMDLPLSVELYERIVWEYLHFFDAFSLTRGEEMKRIFLRSAVWFKKPLQFFCVVLVQLLLCVFIGLFTWGHGSTGAGLVCGLYIVYLVVGGANKTIQYMKCIWTIVRRHYVLTHAFDGTRFEQQVNEYFADDYGILAIPLGFQAFVIAQAYSLAGESPVLNVEHVVNCIVTILVRLTSVCVALLAPDAATAAGTLVTFDFIAQFDDTFVEMEEKYLTAEDFERVRPRPIFREDYCWVWAESIFMVAGGTAVCNCITGLAF